jgi:hypothetical protein|tara:strand:+ start:71 stop:433 length:363 start_codon:yes stop_codon:yes gene_type:complete
MATLKAHKIVEEGLTGSAVACTSGGDEFVNSGLEFLRFRNTDADTYTVTVTAQTTDVRHQNFGKLTKSNITKTVAQNETAYLGPFKQNAFNDSNNKVQITYSGTGCCTNMTVEVLYLDQQ